MKNSRISCPFLPWFGLLVFTTSVHADVLPKPAFSADRYRPLWEASPFAVASPAEVESSQFALVGAAQFEGISYASVVDKQSQGHFVVTSKVPSHGLSLLTLARGTNAALTYATFQSNGGILRLNMDSTPSPTTPNPNPVSAAPLPPIVSIPIMPPPGIRNNPPGARTFIQPVFIPRPPPSSSP